jgi:hypothetical protein
VPIEGVVNALRTLHAALAPGGLVVDTQPVSSHPPVEAAESGELGTLDMREWGRTIELVDGGFAATLRDGLFALEAERSLVVTDSFDNGAEMLATVRDWQGTHIPAELERRVARSYGPVHVHQDIRLRLLLAL